MRLRRLAARSAIVFAAGSALADESRFYPLVSSNLISNLEASGEWQVSASESKISYNCIECDGDVTATIQVTTPYASEQFNSYKARYLSERKAFCAELVTGLSGRCLSTVSTGMRGGALSGFRSEHEENDQRVIETVFFYQNRYFGSAQGPELLVGTISSAKRANLPQGLERLIRWHMARLTIFF